MSYLHLTRAAVRGAITLLRKARDLESMPANARTRVEGMLIDLYGIVATLTTCMAQQRAAKGQVA